MKAQQNQRRGAIGVIVRNETEVLVIQRSETVRAPGRLCFPGGGIEDGESEAAAVVRELHEELAVTVEPVRKLWTSSTASGVLLNWWLVRLPSDQNPKPNPSEVAAYCWMTVEELLRHEATLESNRAFVRAYRAGEFQLEA